MSDLQFAHSQWGYLAWLALAFTALLLALEQRGTSRLQQFLSLQMQAQLVARPARWRRVLRTVFLGLACLSLVLALMRPQWGFRYVETPRVGAEMMICLDVSRSMLAEDVAPNRLERSKAEVLDLLGLLDDDHVGLIAFAGKATVLCPMTPDFGFLRTVLASSGPHSVVRGGTDLEAPIRKALDGFRGEADVSRAIILITDGEDHDSFVLDAARAAAERGVRIITIGFGDPAGSEVVVTDPKTGARTKLRDADGKPVVTRLDDELLRKISQATDSVYIPAGTGALDLKSIYDAHIAPMTRGRLDDRGRTIRQEAYQWMVLLALGLLVAAVTVAGGRPRIGSAQKGTAAAVLLMMLSTFTLPVQAEADQDVRPPREIYNQSLVKLDANDLDDAEQQLTTARSAAGADGALRYRATYNLGWVAIKRADALLAEKPEEALEHLRAAADWFGEAVQLQGDEQAARRNFQIVTRRILALADALAGEDQRDLAALLDEVIGQQRQFVALLQELVQQRATAPLREQYRGLETEQRRILTALGEVGDRERAEAEQIESVERDERTPEQQLRLAQLNGVQTYRQAAQQRLGQTRRELRRQQAQRAYRRATAGLDQLKRARDQLRNLAEMLGALIADASLLARHTADSAVSSGVSPRLPPQYLEESLTTVRHRTDELAARIDAGLASSAAPPEAEQREGEKLIATLHAAKPLIETARQAFAQAGMALTSQRAGDSYEAQTKAIGAFREARELFLDVKGLIELIYTNEQMMRQILGTQDGAIDEYLPLLGQLQAGNLARVARLEGMFIEQLEALPPPAAASTTQPTTQPAKADQQRRQLELALSMLQQIRTTFEQIKQQIDQWEASNDAALLGTPVEDSVAQIEALRRLFFSIVEHLRDTLRRQVELADDTRDVATLSDPDKLSQAVAPLAPRQGELAMIAQAIAEALVTQSQQPPPDASADAAQRLAEAGELVGAAKLAMDQAAEQLIADESDLTSTQEQQDTAVQKLAEALQLLEPPQEQPPDSGQGEDKSQQNEQDQQEQQQQAQQMDVARMLQQVRDRDAQRQRKRQHGAAEYAPVAKDW
jgi:Ca-activated chloride channel family protein